MPIKTEVARGLIITACTEIVENVWHVVLAAEAAQSQATAGMRGAIQTLLDAEPHLYDARKVAEDQVSLAAAKLVNLINNAFK